MSCRTRWLLFNSAQVNWPLLLLLFLPRLLRSIYLLSVKLKTDPLCRSPQGQNRGSTHVFGLPF